MSGLFSRYVRPAQLAATVASLASSAGAGLVGWVRAATGAVARTLSSKVSDTVSVLDFMTTAQRADAVSGSAPTLDSQAAFLAAWNAIKSRGGTLLIPPGSYLWLSPLVLDYSSAPVATRIEGFGARIFAGPAVVGPMLRCVGSYNEFPQEISGLVFDARGNATVGGAIDVVGAHCLHIHHCSIEFHSVGANTYFVHLYSDGGPDPDGANSFWCKVTDCTTRKRSGGEAGTLAAAIKMTGAVNAFTARDNTFSNCAFGILALGEPAGSHAIANAVLIENCFFETLTTAAVEIRMQPGQYGPTGWRLAFNRCEATPAFFSLVMTAAGTALQHSRPPFLIGNYCTAGSVSAWINNPSGYTISVLESSFPGFGPGVANELWSDGMTLRFDVGRDLRLLDSSGTTDFNRGKLMMGNRSIWVSSVNGKVYVKDNGQPTTHSDGIVIGTQT